MTNKGKKRVSFVVRDEKGKVTKRVSFYAQENRNEPFCPVCRTPLVKIKPYEYIGNCKHIPKEVIIAIG